MATDSAAEHLQTIRTLMERSALYRRALAPIMLFAGVVGAVAAVVGWRLGDRGGPFFVVYWAAVASIGLVGALLLVRRQAFRDAEPFWSPPTRRVAAAMAPALFFGAVLAAVMPSDGAQMFLPPLWMALYGCSLHSAGFSISRGIRRFSWLFICAGGVFCAIVMRMDLTLAWRAAIEDGHLQMGATFGLLHLAYGIYLYFTEKSRNET